MVQTLAEGNSNILLESGVRIELTTLVLQTSTHPLCIPDDIYINEKAACYNSNKRLLISYLFVNRQIKPTRYLLSN